MTVSGTVSVCQCVRLFLCVSVAVCETVFVRQCDCKTVSMCQCDCK